MGEHENVHSTTPTGETGVDDLRNTLEHRGRGRVRDAAGVASPSESHLPEGELTDQPTSDDPFDTLQTSAEIHAMQRRSDGPTYERGQGTADPDAGGSSDPNNSLTHANSGDETERKENHMSEVDNQNQSQEPVDGFSDTDAETNVDPADPGFEGESKPLSPEEYRKAQEEARRPDDK